MAENLKLSNNVSRQHSMLDLNILCENGLWNIWKNPIMALCKSALLRTNEAQIRNDRQISAAVSKIEFEESLSTGSDTDTALKQSRR